jgi:hypothetical protein
MVNTGAVPFMARTRRLAAAAMSKHEWIWQRRGSTSGRGSTASVKFGASSDGGTVKLATARKHKPVVC